jgi:hypothetical protein
MFIPKTGGTNSREKLINEAPVGTPLAPQNNNTAPLPTTPQPQPVTPQK